MSINAMTNLAVARREAGPPTHAEAAQAALSGTPDSNRSVATSALNLLITYIPTEILTLYVAVLGAINRPGAEWVAFWCFLVATPAFVWLIYAAKLRAANQPLPLTPFVWPIWEMVAATVAYAAWAFGLPNSPFRVFKDFYSAPLAGVIVLIASTVLGLIAPVVQRAAPPSPLPPNAPPQVQAPPSAPSQERHD
jgi:hypothetical protein